MTPVVVLFNGEGDIVKVMKKSITAYAEENGYVVHWGIDNIGGQLEKSGRFRGFIIAALED